MTQKYCKILILNYLQCTVYKLACFFMLYLINSWQFDCGNTATQKVCEPYSTFKILGGVVCMDVLYGDVL
jgi:hypothetical protein